MGANSLKVVAGRAVVTLVLLVAVAASGGAYAATSGPGGGGGGGGATGSPSGHSGGLRYNQDSAAACGGGLSLPTAPQFQDVGDTVKDLSRATQSYISACGCTAQACIADALDEYARALAEIAPRLPPHLQNAAEIVATAARRVRVAHTKKEALAALSDAMAAIHKDIALVKAEDPDNFQRQTRGGDFVVETLNVASLSLEKAGGL